MIPFFRFVQIISRPSGHHFFLMSDIVRQHVKKIHDLRFIIHQRQHDNAEGILKLCMLVQLIQDHVGIGILAQFYHDTHTFTVRLIPKVRDTVNLF